MPPRCGAPWAGCRRDSRPPPSGCCAGGRRAGPGGSRPRRQTMITIRRAAERGHANHGWLDTWHSFSFDSYYDPAHVQFGPLRVLNEDFVAPGAGFPPHPHRDMEIITIVLEGAVAHRDSTGGEGVTRAGDVQVMTAGKGVVHSEYNPSDERLHLLQIWILPDARGRTPRYDQKAFPAEARRNALLPVVAGSDTNGALRIHQDVTLYASELDAGKSVTHTLAPATTTIMICPASARSSAGRPTWPASSSTGTARSSRRARSARARRRSLRSPWRTPSSARIASTPIPRTRSRRARTWTR